MSKTVIDQSVRYELLNPRESFIVQAPAGSGKTELLTQRILALLSVVEKPENILAITFTKKAAAEMRSRVISALQLGKLEEPTAAHEKYRWKLAQKVLSRDKQLNWCLLENTSRLNITTIDSLSASLASALPLLSQTGALPKIVEDPQPYYEQAIANLIESIESSPEITQAFITLLKHKDNNLPQVQTLLAQMLSKRLQWMGVLSKAQGSKGRAEITFALESVVEEKLNAIYKMLPVDIICELPELLRQVKNWFIKSDKKGSRLAEKIEDFPPLKQPKKNDLLIWQAISEMFFKAGDKSEILLKPDARHGFPPAKKEFSEVDNQRFVKNKETFIAIARTLDDNENWANLLFQIKKLPDPASLENNQQVLDAVVQILPIAAAHLKLVFSQFNVIDFSELSISALEALGHKDIPSDLALALDYKLEHILIDEFQDTSSPQIELVSALTAGWQLSGDENQNNVSLFEARSLFLVGDPMQSIYRFRDANVSLFLKICEEGVGHIQLKFKQLQVNFRSNENIVTWVNQQFSNIMPQFGDLTFSAVSYAHSTAFNASSNESKVESLLTVDAVDHRLQAQKVVQLVEQHLFENKKTKAKKTLAILGRSRSHLSEIIQLLNQKDIAYQALEIDALSQKMVVRDLLNLAFALSDGFDEISWAACMRAPWFALDLNDIRSVFVYGDKQLPVLERLASVLHAHPSQEQAAKQAKYSATQETLSRVAKIWPILNAAISQKGIKPYKKWLLGCFSAVGGLAQLDFESDYADLIAAIDKLVELQEGGELPERTQVEEAMNKLFAAPNPQADPQVQLMTIHKSKGLEFDTVILPRLDATSGKPDHTLLKWTEVILESGKAKNLIAISKATGEVSDPVYQYLNYLDSEKSRFEDQRVLYVAATRAKSRLYLLGNVKTDKKGDISAPQKKSFLGMLWSGISDNYQQITDFETSNSTDLNQNLETTDNTSELFISRQVKKVSIDAIATIPADRCFEANTENSQHDPQIEIMQNDSENSLLSADNLQEIELFDYPSLSSEHHAAIGTVLHRQLQWISEHCEGSYSRPDNWSEITAAQLRSLFYFETESMLNDAIDKIRQAIDNTLADKWGCDILFAKDEAKAELKIHKKVEQNGVLTRVIDRTFVKDDVRWVVDYKSSMPQAGESLESFVEREVKQYLVQVTDYFKMICRLENRKVVAGLYFPMVAHFEKILES